MSLLNIFRRDTSESNAQSADDSDHATAEETHNIEASEPTPQKPSSEDPIDTEAVKEEIVKALKTVYDPEIPVDIYELGLIYDIKVKEDGNTYVQMTLTAPNCPAAGILPGQVESSARSVEGVYDVELDLVFDPPWTPERMSEAAKLELGMF